MDEELMIDKILYIYHSAETLKLYYVFGKCYENVCSYYALLKMLGENFVRINDNTIINFNYVSKCNSKNVTMIENTTLEIEPKYEKTVVNLFFKTRLERFNSNGK